MILISLTNELKSIMKVLRMSRIGQHYFSADRKIDMKNHGYSQLLLNYLIIIHEICKN